MAILRSHHTLAFVALFIVFMMVVSSPLMITSSHAARLLTKTDHIQPLCCECCGCCSTSDQFPP
ncbi:hypothetical protein IC575_003095 [Cucumis melo]